MGIPTGSPAVSASTPATVRPIHVNPCELLALGVRYALERSKGTHKSINLNPYFQICNSNLIQHLKYYLNHCKSLLLIYCNIVIIADGSAILIILQNPFKPPKFALFRTFSIYAVNIPNINKSNFYEENHIFILLYCK